MKLNLLCILLFFSVLISCSDESLTGIEESEQEENPDVEEENPGTSEETYELAGEIELYNQELIEDSYVLVNDAGFNRVYLMNKNNAEILHEWELESGIGNDAELLANGQLLVSLIDENKQIGFGGYAGKIQLINPDNAISWDYTISSDTEISHHDAELLPNGNILVLVWEGKTIEDATQNYGYAYDLDERIFAEKLVEINPETNEIVWQWSAWDHLVQDNDDSLPNYGLVSENPNRINLNYRDALQEAHNGDIMHANGLEYDAENDLILMSVNFYSEVWVLDHSTTTGEATTSEGGSHGLGGDLIYRFGNPEVYENTQGTRSFYHNHGINSIPDTNRALIYVNGGLSNNNDQSVVYELQLPENYNLLAETDNELEQLWSFTDINLFAPKVSGAFRLPNGNTLITEGDYGFWEVTNDKQVAWKFKGKGFFWRAYPYQKDADALNNFEL